MDRRSWPWRKKSSEKILGPNDSVESSPAQIARHPDEQTVPRDHTGFHLDDGTTQWQQSEEKAEQLKERLSVALLDASAKDVLIKQHAKVSEEAVTGWEKAEAEAINLKQELESVVQQKLATEDRVSHLDGALKECMRQLRHVREEQEAKIHDVTMKSLRDWEKTCTELEEKLADMEQRYLDADAKNRAISTLLEERALKISEISEARSRAEANWNILQVRLEAMERDHSALKFECSNLKKELNIRNEEKIASRGSTEAGNSKQHLEDARKTGKLEAEYQRLGGLARKKLPGPGALTHKKLETDASRLKQDSNRKKGGKGAPTLKEREEDIRLKKLQPETANGGKDVDALLDRLSAMEDETRRLKELLARRDNELQHSRLMCARTASKLSSVEEQLECLSRDKCYQKTDGTSALDKHIEAARSVTVSCDASLASVSEDGNDDCSDAWASALISELAHFKIEKISSQGTGLEVPKMQPDGMLEVHPSISLAVDDVKSLEQKLAKKDVELHAAHKPCEQVGDKLQTAEKDPATLQSQNAAVQLSLQAVRCQLDAIFRVQDDGSNVNSILDKVREVIGISHQKNGHDERTTLGFKQPTVEPNLTTTVSMLVRVLENLGALMPSPGSLCKNDEIQAKIRAFSAEIQLFLQGSSEILQILENLVSVLGDIVGVKIAERATLPHASIKPFSGDKIPCRIEEGESFSTISDTTESEVFEEQANRAACSDKSGVSTVPLEQEVTRLEGELRKVRGEKVALETHMRMEFQRFGGLHTEIAGLQGDKLELEHLVVVLKEELDHLRRKLHQEEQTSSNFQEKLSSRDLSKQMMEEHIQSLILTKTDAESQLETIRVEHVRLQDRKEVLERECLEKKEKIAMLELKCQELEKQLSERNVFVCSKCSLSNDGGTANQEQQEIAVKLAECQQTILLLGKQLSTFTSSKEPLHGLNDLSSEKLEGFQLPHNFPNASELPPETRGLLELHKGTPTCKLTKLREYAQKEIEWEPRRDSNASDVLDSELMSLSKSGRPLLELFGDKTPAHEHYIQAVEELTSSSDEELTMPNRIAPSTTIKSTAKPPLHRKKKSPRSYRRADMSKSMDDTSSEKVNTFARLFSRAKNS